MKKILIILGLLIPVLTVAQDLLTYQSRKNFILGAFKDVVPEESGKHGLPKAIARLHTHPNDQIALTYISTILDRKTQNMFDFPGVALALCRYWDSFSQEQIAMIKSDLERLAKSDKIGGEGFLGHGTENHATMMWCSAYLFGQLFPDAMWANGMTSAELMADMKERLRKTFKNRYEQAYTEYLSTTYEVVMNFPVEILLEYARDPEVKAMAEAFMLYKWSLLSLNNFDGNILAPYARMNTQEDHSPTENFVSATSYYNWLMWGWGAATGNVRLSDFKNYRETSYAVYAALSNVIPDKVFFRLAVSGARSFSLKSSASTFAHYGDGIPHMMMRKVFRDKSFAIGTGNFRWVPGGYYADHDNNGFCIVWNSPDRFNYIGCFHPYWYSDGDDKDRTPDTWYKGNISPFQQTAHHQNTVVTLFDIPEKDPWIKTPVFEEWAFKWAWRDGHADGLIKRGMLRYPKSVDEKVEANGWIFLREGETYIGIKPLKDFYTQNNLSGMGLDGFAIVKSDHARTGFIFEIGTKEEFGSFDKFQKGLPENELKIDWETMTVSYRNSQGEDLRIQYRGGLPVDPDGLARSVPSVWINGKMDIPFDQWPMIESPHVNMDDSVLKIHYRKAKILVDWKGAYPKINRNGF